MIDKEYLKRCFAGRSYIKMWFDNTGAHIFNTSCWKELCIYHCSKQWFQQKIYGYIKAHHKDARWKVVYLTQKQYDYFIEILKEAKKEYDDRQNGVCEMV